MFKHLQKIIGIVFLIIFSACSEETVDEFQFGTLTGKVVNEDDNSSLTNVKITTNPVSTTVFTDTNGEFIIEDIRVGEYSVQAELQEYLTEFESAVINEALVTNVVFELGLVESENIAPEQPILITPLDNADNVSSSIEFIWSSGVNDDDEVTYNFELRNEDGDVVQFKEEMRDTTLTVAGLEVGTNYFWQVQALDGINASVQSKLSSFKTRGIGDNRFLYVRNSNGNNVIFSGGEPVSGPGDEGANQNEVMLTNNQKNSYRPRKNNVVEKIAFLRNVGADTHIFTMNFDGSSTRQITSSIPVAGFRQSEIDYTWSSDGEKLFYPFLNKLFSINNDGSGNAEIYSAPDGTFISEIAVNGVDNNMIIKTNNASGYAARIVMINTDDNSEDVIVAEGTNGAMGGLDYSFDGNLILFTRDVSGNENQEYRQLDSRIFEYNVQTMETVEFITNKLNGTNDLDPVYSDDGGAVIFVSTSNDGISEKTVVRVKKETAIVREILFTNSFMPDF